MHRLLIPVFFLLASAVHARPIELDPRYRVPADFNPLWRKGKIQDRSRTGGGIQKKAFDDLDLHEKGKLRTLEAELDVEKDWHIEFVVRTMMDTYIRRKKRGGGVADVDGVLEYLQAMAIRVVNAELDDLQRRILEWRGLEDRRLELEREMARIRARSRRSRESGRGGPALRTARTRLRELHREATRVRGNLPISRLTLPSLMAHRNARMNQISQMIQRVHNSVKGVWQRLSRR